MTQVIQDTFEGNPFGEGFYADKVVKEKNVELGAKYFSLLREARDMIASGKMTVHCVEALHRYNRIMTWIGHQYGNVPCVTKEEFDILYKAKMFDLIMFEGDCWLFWEWLRKVTLEETLGRGGTI